MTWRLSDVRRRTRERACVPAAESGQRPPWSALTHQSCDSLRCRQTLSQEPGEVDLMHEVHEEGRKGGGLGVPDRREHFGLAVSFPEGHSAGRIAGAQDTFIERRNKQNEEKERSGCGGGRARPGYRGGPSSGCLQGRLPPPDGGAHTGRCPVGPGRFPSSRDGTRGSATPRTLGLNSLNQANTLEFRKGKESKTNHHRKAQSLVFMEFESRRS